MAGDWVPCATYGDAILHVAGGVIDIPLFLPGQGVTLAEERVGRKESANQLRIKRIIGYTRLVNPSSENTIFVRERIRVGLWDTNLDQPVTFTDQLSDAEGANEGFLWQRLQDIVPLGSNTGPDFHPWWSFLDVRTARTLSREEVLVYSVSSDAVQITLELRAWCY